jgi:hypothetical protein
MALGITRWLTRRCATTVIVVAIDAAALARVCIAQPALEEPVETARPVTVVAPSFPAGAVADPPGVTVVVDGMVQINGSFAPTAIKAAPGQEHFAAAVSDVLRWWRFVPAIDSAKCAPMATPAQLKIWFEGSAAAPKVFFSFPKENQETRTLPSGRPSNTRGPSWVSKEP